MNGHDWRVHSRDADLHTEKCRGCGCMRVTTVRENPPRVRFITLWGELRDALDVRCLRATKIPSNA